MTEQRFGGPWTEEKLSRLRKYLHAYMKIFSRNKRAAHFRAVYLDAFAGTGFREDPASEDDSGGILFDDVASDTDADALRKGSAQVALETKPPFAQYVFIEHSPDYAHWSRTRAVVFLDPYGMQVDWATIAAMGPTQGVDLWILFPLGVGVNRLLRKEGPPEGAWAERLTRIFGTDEWRDAFYHASPQQELFDGAPKIVKDADFERIAQFWIKRLKTVFPEVAPNPLPLHNSRNVPIYLLSFAAANPQGGKTAVKIAQDILSR